MPSDGAGERHLGRGSRGGVGALRSLILKLFSSRQPKIKKHRVTRKGGSRSPNPEFQRWWLVLRVHEQVPLINPMTNTVVMVMVLNSAYTGPLPRYLPTSSVAPAPCKHCARCYPSACFQNSGAHITVVGVDRPGRPSEPCSERDKESGVMGRP